ncbi:hypothetical protein OS493_017072 [Desmophyllum pertusum]|uniref:Uncharacterized protein n=1 Tax=Desmophyllum pertusum TaxID=174260 RepID=A0A9X0CEB9_9CNID|nr:hypothetical protein OS493_017072 [Desmophyllum pertusum]
MEKEHSKANSFVVSLEVLDLEEENVVELPVVFTWPKLPDLDLDQWPHLAASSSTKLMSIQKIATALLPMVARGQSKIGTRRIHDDSAPDASQVAYGAVSYLRLVNPCCEVHCSNQSNSNT